MICKKCMRLNDDEAKFCSNCGSKLEKEDLYSFNIDDFKVELPDYNLNDSSKALAYNL